MITTVSYAKRAKENSLSGTWNLDSQTLKEISKIIRRRNTK